MIRAFLFDFDGVILESSRIKTDAFSEIFAGESEECRQRIMAYHLEQGGLSRWVKFRYIYSEILQRSLSEADFQLLGKRFQEIVFAKVLEAPLVPGTMEFLEEAHASAALYIVSGTPQDELDQILSRRSLRGYFTGVFGAPTSKLDAIKAILTQGHIAQTNALFVGDALSDYEAAQAAGIPFTARLHPDNTYFEKIPCFKVSDLAQLHRFWKLALSEQVSLS